MTARLSTLLTLVLLALAAPARAGLTRAPVTGSREASTGNLPIAFVRSHSLGRGQARERVRQLLEYWGQRFGIQRAWQGNTARIFGHLFGVSFEAKLVVSEHQVAAEASDPGLFLRGAAIDYINRKLGKYLHPDYVES